jgi:hypothetical protein
VIVRTPHKMRLEPLYRALAVELQAFGEGLTGPRRKLTLNSAAALELLADGAWAPFSGLWVHGPDRVLVYDRRLGVRIARYADGTWIGDGGERLEAVTHWQFLPPEPTT